MSKISQHDIEHIAELSRLALSEEEKERYGRQLASILDYINQLNEVDTTEVEPTAQVSGLVDVWRSDEAKDWDGSELAAALSQGERERGYIKVKRVL